jgi:uncharacterized protein (TIGR00369 family)
MAASKSEVQHVRDWFESSPYTLELGAELESLDAEHASLALPYRDSNSNPGKALHGGCAASLGILGGHAVSRAALGESSGPWHSASLQVNYLSAAIGEDVVAEASLRRRGKAMCFVDIRVSTREQKPVAEILCMVRGRFGAQPSELHKSAGDAGAADPGPMGPYISSVPFIGNRGIRVEHMIDGHSRLVMPFAQSNADAAGGVHEGAVLALLDTTGAMASWAVDGPGPYKASTPSMQAQILAPAPKDDLVAYGRSVQRDGDLYWADAEVAGASDGRVIARGTVIYRIVR